jgi:hypothetical protein
MDNWEIFMTERDDAANYINDAITNGIPYKDMQPYTDPIIPITDLSEYEELFDKYPVLKFGNNDFILPKKIVSWSSTPMDYQEIDRLLDIGYIANMGYLDVTGNNSTPLIISSRESFVNLIGALEKLNIAKSNIHLSSAQENHLLQYFDTLDISDTTIVDRLLDKGIVTNIGNKDMGVDEAFSGLLCMESNI